MLFEAKIDLFGRIDEIVGLLSSHGLVSSGNFEESVDVIKFLICEYFGFSAKLA